MSLNYLVPHYKTWHVISFTQHVFFSLKPDTLSIRSGHTYIKIKLKKSVQYWNTHVHIYETNLEKNPPKTIKTKHLIWISYFKVHICVEEHYSVTTFTIMLKQFTMKIHHMNIHNIALWIFSHNSDSLNPLLRSIHHHTSNGLLWFSFWFIYRNPTPKCLYSRPLWISAGDASYL